MKIPDTQLLVNKTNISQVKFEDNPKPELADGEVLFQIEKYAFTTNNITYAVVGHKIRYWEFFPAENPFGIVPVWGFAKVIESKSEAVEEGERFYGYFPMSTYLKVNPVKISPFGFTDGMKHRNDLPPIYNYYTNTKNDPSYNPKTEDYQPIFRPLFTTSFLNYQFLKASGFFEAEQVILTSASSKTAMGLAYLLNKNKATDGKKVIGLTSKRNVEFVEKTGRYDEVVSYDNFKDISKKDTVIVDFAGNADLLMDLTELLGLRIKFISLIGLTDWKSGKDFKLIPKSKFFFAPDFAKKLFSDLGREKANQMVAEALAEFIEVASKQMTLEFVTGKGNLKQLYLQILSGMVDPSVGYLVSLRK